MFVQPFVQAQIKENIKAPRHWPLWWESTGDKGPVTGKMFQFDDVIMVSPIREDLTELWQHVVEKWYQIPNDKDFELL